MGQTMVGGLEDMTRDEQRAACIKAMKAGYLGYREPENIGEFFDSFDAAFTAAFDAQHGLALVVKSDMFKQSHPWWHKCLEEGDLTNEPRGKTGEDVTRSSYRALRIEIAAKGIYKRRFPAAPVDLHFSMYQNAEENPQFIGYSNVAIAILDAEAAIDALYPEMKKT